MHYATELSGTVEYNLGASVEIKKLVLILTLWHAYAQHVSKQRKICRAKLAFLRIRLHVSIHAEQAVFSGHEIPECFYKRDGCLPIRVAVKTPEDHLSTIQRGDSLDDCGVCRDFS